MKIKRNFGKEGRPAVLHQAITKPHVFESSRLSEFASLCAEEGISVSEGLRLLIEEKLEKKEWGANNPLNIQYNKKQSIQTNLLSFIDQIPNINEQKTLSKMMEECAVLRSTINKRSMELYKQGIRK